MRHFTPLCFLFFLFAAACTPSGPQSDPDLGIALPLDTVFHRIDAEVRAHARTYETLKEATETIGHRLTGSPNGAKAEEYAFNLLKSYGYEDVEYFGFSVNAWARDTVALQFYFERDTVGMPVEVVSLAHSPVEFEGQADLLDLGNGLRKNFDQLRKEVPGKFVLLNLGLDGSDSTDHNLHRSEKTALAIEYGAAGVIFANSVEGNILLTGAASVTGDLIPIPAVCIGRETAEDVRARLVSGRTSARISMRNKSELIRARDVIAVVPGRELPGETILIGGHLDSWDLATGAIDNGIGSFTVMEIARVFKALHLRPRRSVEFVLFMGEEQGLLGSTALAEKLGEDGGLEQVKYMINLDMTGNPIGFRSMGHPEAEPWLKGIGDKMHAIDTIFRNTVATKAGLHSDHQPFMLRGIPILGLESNLDPSIYRFYHSNGDDFTLVNAEHLHNTARFAAMVLYALADADTLPALRMDDLATRDFLIGEGLKEKLVLGKEWRWEE
jgi:hypothetical protein